MPAEATPFRSLGTYGVWFPRGLLLRLAGRDACKRLLEEWQATGEPTATAEVEAACARVLADPDLRPEALTARIEAERAWASSTVPPREALTRLLATLEEQSQQSLAQDDPGNWARQAVTPRPRMVRVRPDRRPGARGRRMAQEPPEPGPGGGRAEAGRPNGTSAWPRRPSR